MSDAAKPSLLRRLFLRIGVTVVLLLVAGGVLSYLGARHYANEVYDRWLYDSARSLRAQIRFVSQQPALDLPTAALEMFVFDEHDDIYFEVVSARRGRVAGNSLFPEAELTSSDPEARFLDLVIDGKPVRAVSVSVASPTRDDTIRITVGETVNKRATLTQSILLTTIPAQLLLMLAGVLAVRWSVRDSIRALSETASAIRARDPLDMRPVRFSESPLIEIEPLITAINDLLERVDAAKRSRQRFVANAAHQLRTPVSSLQIQIDRALLETNPEERGAALRQVDQAIRRLGHLLHQLMMLARVEVEGQSDLVFSAVDLVDAARSAVERQVDDALKRSVDLGFVGPLGQVLVEGEPTLLDEMLRNLIENALRYGRQGGQVTVGVETDPPQLFVEDDGPGIRPSEWESVFDRFYRSPRSPGPGAGLGLAIVKEIAERHHASVSLGAPADGQGTRVTIRFASTLPAGQARTSGKV